MGFENLFILDPSTYACDQCTVDSARKLWETLRRRSQDLAMWASRSSIQPKLIPYPSAYASDWGRLRGVIALVQDRSIDPSSPKSQ